MKNLYTYIVFVFLLASFSSCTGDLDLRNESIDKIDLSEEVRSEFTRNGLTINLDIRDINYSYIQKVRLTNYFFSVYPLLKNAYNENASLSVKFVIDPDYEGKGYTEGNTITLSGKYLMENPTDLDAVANQLMHVVQDYDFQNVPEWLAEGLQYYARLKFGQNNSSADFVLPTWSETQSYDDGKLVTARFLSWLALNYDNGFINRLNEYIRNYGYSNNVWTESLPSDKSFQEILNLYNKYPELENRLDEPKNWSVYAKGIVTNWDNDWGADSGEGSMKLIDNNNDTKFYLNTYYDDFYMQQEFDNPVPIDRYEFVTGNDSPDRDPKNWTFLGSNDGANWDLIDTRENITFDGRKTSRVFFLSQERTYKYFKVRITANNGGWAFQMSEWRLYNVIDL